MASVTVEETCGGDLTNGIAAPREHRDLVKILHISDLHGRVAQFRGQLGPSCTPMYRVEVRKKPKPSYVEVRADQLEGISTKG